MSSSLALVGGALAGSAAGAALGRWPQGETLARPARSRCTACGTLLRARHLVPVVSWLALRGRCATCGAPIDARLPLLEASSALLVVAAVRVHGVGASAVLLAVGGVALLLAAMSDLERLRIPDRLTFPLAAVGLVGLVLLRPEAAPAGLLWALGVPATMHAAGALAERSGLRRPVGRGDTKLLVGVLALAGLVDGGPATVLVLTVLAGGVASAVGLATGRLRSGDVIPLAPAVALAYLLVVLVPSIPSVLDAATVSVGGGVR